MRVKPLLILVAVLAIASCGTKQHPLPVETETKEGKTIVRVEPQRTASRKNVPAGVDPDDVVAHFTTPEGLEFWATDEGDAYMNKAAADQGATADRPKKSRALWLIIGAALAGLLALDQVLRRFFGTNPIAWTCKLLRAAYKKLRWS